MGLGHDNDHQRCSSHQIFEDLIKQSIDNLSERMADGVAALRVQNQATTESLERTHRALEQVLSNQSERREWCGKQGSRIDALEKSDNYQWSAIHDLRKKVYMAAGAIILAQVVVVPSALIILKRVWP